MDALFFQTLEIHERESNDDPFAAPGPFVRVTERSTQVLVREAVGSRLNQELSLLAPRIRAAMPIIGGVLLCVALHEANDTTEDGLREQSMVSLEIVGTGRIPALVLSLLRNQPRREYPAPDGWRTRTVYLWATV